MLKIHERSTAEGELRPVFLRFEAGVLSILDEHGAFPLPADALDAVMTRFGKPLDPEAQLRDVGALDLGEGRTLRHVRYLERYDVIARDYLIYTAVTQPLCLLAITAAGALAHLARAASRA